MASPTRLEHLPDETLIQIFYELPPKEAAALCNSNPNLARFCREKEVRLKALINHYRREPNLDKIFVSLLTGTSGDERDLERLEAILTLHREWLNVPLVFVEDYGTPGEGNLRTIKEGRFFARPLEVAVTVPIIRTLLDLGVDPLLPSLSNWWEFRNKTLKMVYQRIATRDDRIPETVKTILYESSTFSDPLLHLVCIEKGYRLSWSELRFDSVNTEILMAYAVQLPPSDLKVLEQPIGEGCYFPVLQLLQTVEDSRPLKRGMKDTVIDVTIASYCQIELKFRQLVIDLSVLEQEPSPLPFYLLRQLDFLVGPLSSKVWEDGNMAQQLANLSIVQVALPPSGFASDVPSITISLNYYSGLGLACALSLFRLPFNVNPAQVMNKTLKAEDEGFPILPLDTDYTYRLNPKYPFYPHLLKYQVDEEEGTVQYEHPDFAAGFKLAAYLTGKPVEEVVTILS